MTSEVRTVRKRPDDHLLDEAAEWIGRLRSPDLPTADRQAFARWLDRSPAHLAAFDIMADLYDGLGVLANEADASPASRAAPATRTRSALLAVAAVLCLGLVAALWSVRSVGDLQITTARGERADVMLADGSRLLVNTDTAVRFHMDDDDRELRLGLGGEIFVEVAPDAGRPLTVITDHGRARALGTAFAVHAGAARMRVGVLEGEVEVRVAREPSTEPTRDGAGAGTVGAPSAIGAGAMRLVAGQQTEVTAGTRATAVRPLDASTLAWRSGRLVYDDVRLAELVEDLNRYLPRRMTISDSDLAATRVSAVLRIDEQERMLDALGEVLPLDWVAISETVVVIHPL